MPYFDWYGLHSCTVFANSRSWPSSRNINGTTTKDIKKSTLQISETCLSWFKSSQVKIASWGLIYLIRPSLPVAPVKSYGHNKKSDLPYAMVDPTCFGRQRPSFDSSKQIPRPNLCRGRAEPAKAVFCGFFSVTVMLLRPFPGLLGQSKYRNT